MEMVLGVSIPLAVVVLFYICKANATVLFFIACTSSLLFNQGTRSLENILGSVVPGSAHAAGYIIPAILALPLLIGLLLQARHGKKWLMVQLIPSIACGLIVYVLTVRAAGYLYGVDWRHGPVWQVFSAHEDLLIAIGTFVCLILMPMGGKGGGGHAEKHAH